MQFLDGFKSIEIASRDKRNLDKNLNEVNTTCQKLAYILISEWQSGHLFHFSIRSWEKVDTF